MPTYFGAVIFGLPVWLVLFYFRHDLRHKMLFMSILLAIIAPIDTFFIPSYWRPVILQHLFGLPIDVFTVLFGFELGGVASVIYEEAMRKTFVRTRRKHHRFRFLLAIGPIALYLLKALTAYNFMIDVLVALLLMISVVLLLRRDFWEDVLLSGLLFATIYTVLLGIYILLFPAVLSAWNFQSFPQHVIFDVPQYEIFWAFCSGAFLGPAYEFSHDYVLRSLSPKRSVSHSKP